MAAQSHTRFVTREGAYKLIQQSEYSKPNRIAHYHGQRDTPVKLSFVDVNDGTLSPHRLCFNVGKELYVHVYNGIRKAADLTKPIVRRIYKGAFPTCHDFNQHCQSAESALLVVGFTAGQLQVIDPLRRDISKLYNDDRLVEETDVTCIKWIPGSPNQFLASHSSGQMYLYSEELPCGLTTPRYKSFKQGDGFSVFTCKKRTRNPLYRWVIGQGAIHEFAFSPCGGYLAVVSQDGHLRVFQYNSMELVGTMKSFFGGLLCVCWSPDGKYLVTGGEDDLVTVWSFYEKRVVCRGHGHRSWVNMVAFDAFSSICDEASNNDVIGSDSELGGSVRVNSTSSNLDTPVNLRPPRTLENHPNTNHANYTSTNHANYTSNPGTETSTNRNCITYRFGSVGQDTVLCLWDLTENILKQPYGKSCSKAGSQKVNSVFPATCNDVVGYSLADGDGTSIPIQNYTVANTSSKNVTPDASNSDVGHKKEHKRKLSHSAINCFKSSIVKSNKVRAVDGSGELYGTLACPLLRQVPNLEPVICKKVSRERVTALAFHNECIVTACHEGIVHTWARPGKGLRDGGE